MIKEKTYHSYHFSVWQSNHPCIPAWNQRETCAFSNVWYRRIRCFRQLDIWLVYSLCKSYQNKLDIPFLSNLTLDQTQPGLYWIKLCLFFLLTICSVILKDRGGTSIVSCTSLNLYSLSYQGCPSWTRVELKARYRKQSINLILSWEIMAQKTKHVSSFFSPVILDNSW